MSNVYIKKPVKIEAFQMTLERRRDNSDWPNWLHEAWNKEVGEEGSVWCVDGSDRLHIGTLEGVYDVTFNDYIIQGVNKEIYACKPEIFEKTYYTEDEYDNLHG